MSKLRIVRAAVPVEHPQIGGVFHIRPADNRVLNEYNKSLVKLKANEDVDDGGMAIVDFMVDTARQFVERIEELVDENHTPIESSPEIVEAILAQVYEAEELPEEPPEPPEPEAMTEVGGEGSGEPVKKRTRRRPWKLVAMWVLQEAEKLGQARKADQVKNS